MAELTLEQLENKFLRAHTAGDTKNAAIFAKEIKRIKAMPPEKTLGEAATSAFYNTPQSAYENLIKAPIEFVKTAVTDPEQAARAVLSPIAGAVRQISGLKAAPTDPMAMQSSADFNKLKDLYIQRYGSMRGFKETLATDPFGILTDLATVASPPLKAAGIAAKMPGLLNVGVKVAVNPVGELLGAGVRQAAKIPAAFAGPSSRARSAIADLAEQHPGAGSDLAALGPSGAVADVLGTEGTRRGRTAYNLSPEAGDVIDQFAETRREGKPARLLAAEEDTRAAHRPIINEAYRTAKTEGYDLPKVIETVPPINPFMNATTRKTNIPAGFEDVINDPMMKPFWNKAEKLVGALERAEDQGDFARLDKFRSLLNQARFKSKDPTTALAFEEAVGAIDTAMDAANISPGREAARAAHGTMVEETKLAKDLAARIERRFARTEQGLRGNSTTIQQGLDVSDILGGTGIMWDFLRGNVISATTKLVGRLMGTGMDKANAQRLAAQMVEEAKILTGKEFPTRPMVSKIGQAGRLLGDQVPYAVLLGSKSNQILGGGGGY